MIVDNYISSVLTPSLFSILTTWSLTFTNFNQEVLKYFNDMHEEFYVKN